MLGEVQHLTSSYLLPLLMLITKGIMILFILALLLFARPTVTLLAVFILGIYLVII